jgi:Cysteine dioxygenase type I
MVPANLGTIPVMSDPSTVQSVCGPTRLRLSDLLDITDQAADEVPSGCYDHLLPQSGMPTDNRWWVWLHLDDEIDIQLINWVPGHATELHDHGESLGALRLLSGSLHESRWDGKQLRGRRLNVGDQARLPLGLGPDRRSRFGNTESRTERARVFAAGDRDVVLRDHGSPYPARAAQRIDRPAMKARKAMSPIDRVLNAARRRPGACDRAARRIARRHPPAGPDARRKYRRPSSVNATSWSGDADIPATSGRGAPRARHPRARMRSSDCGDAIATYLAAGFEGCHDGVR